MRIKSQDVLAYFKAYFTIDTLGSEGVMFGAQFHGISRSISAPYIMGNVLAWRETDDD